MLYISIIILSDSSENHNMPQRKGNFHLLYLKIINNKVFTFIYFVRISNNHTVLSTITELHFLQDTSPTRIYYLLICSF